MNNLAITELCMERTGRVAWPVFGEDHCGAKEVVQGGRVEIEYWAKLRFSPDSLDDRGFLVDNMAIERFMAGETRTPTALSCERLVRYCIERFVAYVNATEPKCRILSFEMTLSPDPFNFKDGAVYRPVVPISATRFGEWLMGAVRRVTNNRKEA